MKIVWSTLWFLDYRIAVFKELSQIEGVDFYLIYNQEVNSESINQKIRAALKGRAIPMTGEVKLGSNSVSGFANKGFRIPYQPGLVKQIRALQPDVMVSDGFFQWTYAPLYLRATAKIPHVMCYERTNHTERSAQVVRKLYRKLALKWIDVICCSGELCGQYVTQLGFDKSRITFGHMAADVESLKNQVEKIETTTLENLKQKLELSQTTYIYVGRMIELKGIMQLLNAWRDFSYNFSYKPTLVLVGSGEQDDMIKSEIKTKQLDNVRFVGRISYDDIATYYKLADVLVIPTLEDNWSLVVPEAMSCGLPVITSVYNGCWPELVQKRNGWVVDPLNHEDFVKTLTESYKKRSDFKTMGQVSYEIVQKYTPATAAKQIYESCQIAIGVRKNGYPE